MQSVPTTGRLLNPQFHGLHSIDHPPLIVFSFCGGALSSDFVRYAPRRVGVGPIERLLAIPVYLVYWVVGISTTISVALAYVNSNHDATFDNIFEFIISDPTAQKFYAARYAIVLVAFLTLMTRHALHARDERKKWISILQEIEKSREIFDHIREELSQHSGRLTQEFKYQLNLELTRLANATCNILNAYTKSECHVAIKTLSSSGYVQTATRCEASATARRDADDRLESFHYEGNTAFEFILRPISRWRSKRAFYFSNNLRLLWLIGCYKNQNKGWRREYRATLVVPKTTAKSADQINLENTYGFVCVDNRKGNFDGAASRILLAQTASLCTSVIARLSRRNS